MNRCEYFEQLISERRDRELTVEEESHLNGHVANCQSCREFAAAVVKHSATLGGLPLESASARLVLGVHPKHLSPLARLWHTRVSLPLPAAVAAVVVLAGGLFAILRDREAREVDSPVPEPTIEYVQVEVVPASSAKPLRTLSPRIKE